MQDERGVYYYPILQNKQLRVYVRKNSVGTIEFRLWHETENDVWEKHSWLSYDVIVAADQLYKKERDAHSSHTELYDLTIAQALLN